MGFFYIFLTLVSFQWTTAVVKASTCEIAQVCVTDLSQEECGGAMILVPGVTISGCCPGCVFPSGETEGDNNNSTATCRPPANCLEDGRHAPVQCKGDLFKGRQVLIDSYRIKGGNCTFWHV